MLNTIMSSLSPWDLALLVVVTVMGTLLAYVSDPKWKAFLLGLPFPFTLANLSLTEQVGPSHVMGMAALLLFPNIVRWLYDDQKVPIVTSIALSAGVYLTAGALLNRFVSKSTLGFWIALGLALSAEVLLLLLLPHRQEPAHRSAMPVLLKIAAIAGEILSRVHAAHAHFRSVGAGERGSCVVEQIHAGNVEEVIARTHDVAAVAAEG